MSDWGADELSPGDGLAAQQYSPRPGLSCGVGSWGGTAAGCKRFLHLPPCRVLLLPAFPFCPFALLGTMRSALLLAAILALSLARGAVCEESQEQMVPGGGRKEVRYPCSQAALAEYWATREQRSASHKSCRGEGRAGGLGVT